MAPKKCLRVMGAYRPDMAGTSASVRLCKGRRSLSCAAGRSPGSGRKKVDNVAPRDRQRYRQTAPAPSMGAGADRHDRRGVVNREPVGVGRGKRTSVPRLGGSRRPPKRRNRGAFPTHLHRRPNPKPQPRKPYLYCPTNFAQSAGSKARSWFTIPCSRNPVTLSSYRVGFGSS
jgi:hypothetical protein